MDTKMQREPGELSPFQERVDVNLFFAGAQRRKILEGIKNAIIEAVPVITITGDEGTGKTMLCRMVEKELPINYSCVYLANTLESFDDVIRILALGLGTENSKKPGTTQDLVIEISRFLQDNNRRLIALFDQSERMYLATLERIRKMLDQINAAGVTFQIVLAGRKMLLENLKQLSICDFKTVEERDFRLDLLGLSETYAYLNHCVQQRPPARGKNLFTPEAAKKIYSMAQGNFRMTNMLAEKSLESFDSETSFMVLLENVCDQGGNTRVKQQRQTKVLALSRSFLQSQGKKVYGALALGFLVIVIFVFAGEDKKPAAPVEESTLTQPVDTGTEPDKVINKQDVVVGEKADSASGGNEKDSAGGGQQAVVPILPPEQRPETVTKGELSVENAETATVPLEATSADVVAQTAPPVTGTKIKVDTLETISVPIAATKDVVEQPQTQVPQAITNGNLNDGVNTGTKIAQQAESSPAEKRGQIAVPMPVQVSSVSTVSAAQAEVELITLTGNKKRKPLQLKVEPEGGTKRLVKVAPVKVKIPAADGAVLADTDRGEKTSEQLYRQRIAAASQWLNGGSSDKHTVQLMMLTAEEAEANLKKRLDEEEYRQIADKLYIVKNSDASTVFVYYGEYADPDSARNARNTLPVFLRKYDPYAISIDNVVKKATAVGDR